MSFLVNCGLEIQTPELNIGILKNNELFCPSEYFSYFLDSSKLFSVYADADTDLSDAQKTGLIKKFKSSGEIRLVFESPTDTISTSVLTKRNPCNQLFNDAEFILTDLDKESITENELGLYLARNCLKGARKVSGFLNNNTDAYRLAGVSSSSPKKTPTMKRSLRSASFVEKDWIFSKLFKVKKNYAQSITGFRHIVGTTQPLGLENLVFFSKEDYEPIAGHFYFQATLGLPLDKVWPMMVALSKIVAKMNFLPRDDLQDINYILELNSTYQKQKDLQIEDPFLFSFAPLIHYWIYSNDDRKKHGFFIRHFMTHLLRVLTEDQLAKLKTIDSRVRQNQQLIDTLWKEPFFPIRANPGQEMQVRERRIIIKELENILFGSVFPLQIQGKDTFVLVEIRYLNYILNYFLNPRARRSVLLSVDDLERIVRKLEHKTTRSSPTPPRTTKRRKTTGI